MLPCGKDMDTHWMAGKSRLRGQIMKQTFSAITAIMACMGVGSALADETGQATAVNATEIVTTVCAMCHGEDGNKMLTPETPKIGGQKSDYLVKALRDYRNGGRKNPIMGAVSQPLTDAEVDALAEYFSAQQSQLYTLK